MQHPYMCLVPRLPETHSLASPLVENVYFGRSWGCLTRGVWLGTWRMKVYPAAMRCKASEMVKVNKTCQGDPLTALLRKVAGIQSRQDPQHTLRTESLDAPHKVHDENGSGNKET